MEKQPWSTDLAGKAGARRANPAPAERASAGAPDAMRRIIERHTDGILVLDEKGTVCFANDAAAGLLGVAQGELLGSAPKLSLDAGETCVVELPGTGTRRIAEQRILAIEWQGHPASLVSLRDVTERRSAEKRERDLALEHARRVDAERRANRAAFRAAIGTALGKSLALGINLHELTHACCQSGFSDWCAVDLLEDGQLLRRSASADVPDLRSAGEQCLDGRSAVLSRLDTGEAQRMAAHLAGDWSRGCVACVPVHLHGEPAGLLVFVRRDRDFEAEDVEMARDAAERVAIALEHAHLYEEAHRAAHAKSQFLAVMSHELRTPLNAVIGYSDLLLLGIAGPMNDKQRDIISKVQSSSKHLISLVEEILTYTRMERGQEALIIEPVTVGVVVGETVDLIAPMARASGLELRTSIERPAQQITTDPLKLRQLLSNLLTNAIKYTEEGFVSLQVRTDGAGVLIEVADSGIGMTQEHIAHIYDPFWQAEPTNTRRRGGTGLGLTVAMQLTRMMGGRLHVRSELGHGSTFTLRLPAAPPAGKAA